MKEKKINFPEELPTTIEGCHALIKELRESFLTICIQFEKLRLENQSLKERLDSHSGNSSKPPSTDFKKKKEKRPPSSRTSGAQPGHRGHFRKMLPSSEVDSVVYCQLPKHCECGGVFAIKPGKCQRHQVYELPEIKLNVTEYELAKGACITCGRTQTAPLPKGITWGLTGPRLTSLMTHLVSNYHLSRRSLQRFLKDHFQFDIALGTLFRKQQIMTEILEKPTLAWQEEVKQSPWVNIDETGHRYEGQRAWLWGMVSRTAAYFSIQPSRGKKVLRALMGESKAIIISDRYAAYNLFNSARRQLCWAHLKRDFTRLSERRDPIVRRIGLNLLKYEADLFKNWHAFKQERLTRFGLIQASQPICRRIGECLEQGSYTDPTLRIARFCKRLLEQWDALWTFLHEEGVEPTNNRIEQSLRPWVIWRKIYFGTRSTYGSEFISRTASLLTTCKIQSKNAFEYLCQLTTNHFQSLQINTS